MTLMPLGSAESVTGMPDGVLAWTTTRADGSYGLGSAEPVGEIMERWARLQHGLAALRIERLATAHQVHGAAVERHDGGWRGWLRLRGVDGHVTKSPGTALAVTVADCTPVFVAHPGGAVAALHAGWRGTAARILDAGLDALGAMGFPADECVVHLGPSICGPCYEVGPEVLSAVYGRPATGKGQLDVREVLREQAWRRGVQQISSSSACTRCHADRFFSHRGGDPGRQLGVIALQSS
ncbi:polyphenol oxidase family protein [Gemmatimonas sp.]|jgi:YfiH family protein|uniref:polyphenol oxidase family protein n=1 Tax=Gemmatimonas sp. TaxID=1962908 RepID=UPI0037BE68D4